MKPIVISSKPYSLLMAGAAVDMLTRSRYVMKYIRLIRSRTSQRFLPERFGSPFMMLFSISKNELRFYAVGHRFIAYSVVPGAYHMQRVRKDCVAIFAPYIGQPGTTE